jgi:hypothetical protein
MIIFFDVQFFVILWNEPSKFLRNTTENEPSNDEQKAKEVKKIEGDILSKLSMSDKKDILLKRFEESCKENRLFHDFNWKGVNCIDSCVSFDWFSGDS